MQRLKVVTFDVVALDVIYFVNAHAFMDLAKILGDFRMGIFIGEHVPSFP